MEACDPWRSQRCYVAFDIDVIVSREVDLQLTSLRRGFLPFCQPKGV
jgi:hypothetical protein